MNMSYVLLKPHIDFQLHELVPECLPDYVSSEYQDFLDHLFSNFILGNMELDYLNFKTPTSTHTLIFQNSSPDLYDQNLEK